ncbi:MAG TPA: hypothetical protein VKV26_04585 [Dehalococcoidia bacterium]|nr:hypothetical protein [Dehalococcoidia bacterium]
MKEELHQIVDALSEEEAEELLDFLNLRADPDTLTPDELARVEAAEQAAAAGDYVTLEEWRRSRRR